MGVVGPVAVEAHGGDFVEEGTVAATGLIAVVAVALGEAAERRTGSPGAVHVIA